MKLAQSLRIFCLLTIALLIIGCGGGGDSTSSGGDTTPPTGVSATAGDSQVQITWTGSTGATSYNIYWSTASGVTKTTGTKITGATSPYTDTGRTNGTTYYYVVTAVNNYGESSESSQVSATPSETPSNVSVSIVSGAANKCETAYDSATVTIAVGGTVTWTNNDSFTHTVTSSNSATGCPSGGDPAVTHELDSGNISASGTYSHTFTTAGTFSYACIIPGHTMRGTVIVQ